MTTSESKTEKPKVEPQRLALFEITSRDFTLEGEKLLATAFTTPLMKQTVPLNVISLKLGLHGGRDLKRWSENGGRIVVAVDIGEPERPTEAAEILVEFRAYARYFEKTVNPEIASFYYKSQNPQLEMGFICDRDCEDMWDSYQKQNAKFRIFLSHSPSA